MRVGIDATCWSNPRGYGRYARGLLTALVAESSPHDFILFVDASTRADPRWPMPLQAQYVVVPTAEAPARAASAAGSRSLRDVWAMSTAVARTPLEVMFYPSVYTYFPALTRARTVLGVHDVIAEDYPRLVFPDARGRVLWRLKGWLAHRQADYVVAVSDHAKAGILRRFGHRPDRVWVVSEAPDPAFRPVENAGAVERALARHGLAMSERFIVCLGGLNPHKNLDMLLEVVAGLRREARFGDLRLALIGPAESDIFTPGASQTRLTAARLGLDGAVRITGYLPDDEVACLLSAARALALPSFDEGFGLAAIEAAACGTPVIATRNSPLPRLLEGGGFFLDPTQPEAWRRALAEILDDEGLCARLGRTAREQARRLTWRQSAGQMLGLLDVIAAHHRT